MSYFLDWYLSVVSSSKYKQIVENVKILVEPDLTFAKPIGSSTLFKNTRLICLNV